MPLEFPEAFKALTGNPPFPWQVALYDLFVKGEIPKSCNLPTGLGKTSVIAIWLLARLKNPGLPRRLVYVVNRRTVVDQTTEEVKKYKDANLSGVSDFAVSTLRGQYADNGKWCNDPSRPAVICGTVDMIGSRLLFSGYGIGFKAKPLHAGFLGQDSLLVHDEAHLEPAFQELILKIEDEQKFHEPTVPWPKLQVMELTATRRGTSEVFELTPEELAAPDNIDPAPRVEPPETGLETVHRRLRSRKGLKFHPCTREEIAKNVAESAYSAWKDSGKAILIFVRTVMDVETVRKYLEDRTKTQKPSPVQVLTGTLRGLERDRLADADPIFARFMPKPKVETMKGTVYLVCTSAGEVGVDISADQLVSDLTTFESMAQRFGRVNRRGIGQARIDIFYETNPDPKKKDEAYEKARWKTKAVLERLQPCHWIEERLEASPLALKGLDLSKEDRDAAFAPPPTILPASDILFDAWALTSIKGKLPGRPPVEPYLHGIEQKPTPETQVAWREEVERLSADDFADDRTEILSVYPLQPREVLKEPTYRAFDKLKKIAERNPAHFCWLVDEEGVVRIEPLTLFQNKDAKEAIENMTVILDPRSGGLAGGMLDGTAVEPVEDVADNAERVRVWDDDEKFVEKTHGMHEVYDVEFPSSAEDDEDAEAKVWRWFVRKNTGELTNKGRQPITLAHHVGDVETAVKKIIQRLPLEPFHKQCLEIAAKYHDDGKKRANFQRMLGNNNPNVFWAKSGSRKGTRLAEKYRHEFGSMHNIIAAKGELGLPDDAWELILHLIATHHGRARPHFSPDEAFDPSSTTEKDQVLASSVPRRFGLLQRKYGRWGLAYLESLLRAADWEASDHPSDLKESKITQGIPDA